MYKSKNGYEQRAITVENGIHIGWIDLKTLIKQIKMQNWESRLVIKNTGVKGME